MMALETFTYIHIQRNNSGNKEEGMGLERLKEFLTEDGAQVKAMQQQKVRGRTESRIPPISVLRLMMDITNIGISKKHFGSWIFSHYHFKNNYWVCFLCINIMLSILQINLCLFLIYLD